MLAHDPGSAAADFPLLVALHARGGEALAEVARTRAIFGDGPDIFAPQAARPCNPFQSNHDAGGYQGFSWYLGDDVHRPEAASFGDALAQLDQLLRSLDRPFVLVGEGQGAVLALTLALYAPDRLAAVAATGAGIPRIEGWDLPRASLSGVDVTLTGLDASEQKHTLTVLCERQANVGNGEAPASQPWMKSLRSALTALLFAMLSPSVVLGASAGPQPASTGAPAIGSEAPETTCISCHTSFALNPDNAGSIKLEGAPEKYEPGKTYTLTIRVSHSDKAALRWGFQMTAIALKDGSGAGDFLATDEATTQVLLPMSGTRSYVVQSYGGTAIGQGGGNAWTFQWKAPVADVGKVGFFAAGNAGNADGSNQGDRIYSPSPQPIAESAGPGG